LQIYMKMLQMQVSSNAKEDMHPMFNVKLPSTREEVFT